MNLDEKHFTFFLTEADILSIETALAFTLSAQDLGDERALLARREPMQTALATVKAQAYTGTNRSRK